MATTKDDIRRWLQAGLAKGASHVVVMCDTFDWDDYPVYVMPGQDPENYRKHPGEMQKAMECYDLRMDLDEQLRAHRANNWAMPAPEGTGTGEMG